MKINIASTKEATISDNLLEKIKDKLNSMSNPKFYFDYRDELSEKQVSKIISEKEGWQEVQDEIWESTLDHMYDIEKDHIVDALEWFKGELQEELGEDVDLEEVAAGLRDELLDYVSVEIDYNQLLSNTGSANCRIELYSNNDCINSHHFETTCGGYRYEGGSYFADMVNILNLNPTKLKQAMIDRDSYYLEKHGYNFLKFQGRFPNKPNRNGKEYVDYEKFLIELENTTCGANLLTIVCKVDLQDIVKNGGMPTKFIVPKGNTLGLYSSMQGGGSTIECELLRDMVIDTKAGKSQYDHWGIMVDGKGHGYSMRECYCVDSSFYGDEIKIIE